MGLENGLKIFQPCMGFYLQGSVKALAIVEIGVQLAATAIILHNDITDRKKRFLSNNENTGEFCAFIFTLVYCYVYKIVSILLAITLYISAAKRNRRIVLRWLIVSVIMFLALFSCIIVNNGMGLGNLIVPDILFAALVLYKLYSFWVVYSFTNEIQRNGDTDAVLNGLSDIDVEDFFNGTVQTSGRNSFLATPYQKDFEIKPGDLTIEKSSPPLGSGAFGIVYKGILTRNSDAGDNSVTNQIVAVKTIHSNANGEHFKSLLRELQILNYVGKHENIVNLIGACTASVKEGNLYVVVEFCGLGSLLSYLQCNRDGLQNELHQSNYVCIGNGYIPRVSELCREDLFRWSIETARGMEYISSKNVIHGDLSARNVLLSFDKVAKIADFGLSKQLYRCTTYTKQGNVVLPWKWLAAEALCELKFSTHSDVWSYGVMLCEIFSCGETPYPGLEYTPNFIEQLKTGHVMPGIPQYASNEMYDELKKCWRLNPKSRPSFQELRIYFEKLLDNYSVTKDRKQYASFISCQNQSIDSSLCCVAVHNMQESGVDQIDENYD